MLKVRAHRRASKPNGITVGKEYVVVGVSSNYFRVVNDYDEPTLFKCTCFDIIDGAISEDDWVCHLGEEGEVYANPPGLHLPGFYEDYFDDKEYAIKRFQEYLDKIGVSIQAKPCHTPPWERGKPPER